MAGTESGDSSNILRWVQNGLGKFWDHHFSFGFAEQANLAGTLFRRASNVWHKEEIYPAEETRLPFENSLHAIRRAWNTRQRHSEDPRVIYARERDEIIGSLARIDSGSGSSTPLMDYWTNRRAS